MEKVKPISWVQNANYKIGLLLSKKYLRRIFKDQLFLFYLDPTVYLCAVVHWILQFLSIFQSDSSVKAIHLPSYGGSASPDTYPYKARNLVQYLLGIEYLATQVFSSHITNNKIKKEGFNFNISTEPEVSFLIFSSSPKSHLPLCIASLAQNLPSELRIELLIIGAYPPQIIAEIKAFRGIYVPSENGASVAGIYNAVVANAKGRYICLLNSDVSVMTNWFENLELPFTTDETVGVVGSKILYNNGLLKAAGSIVYDDASTVELGKGEDPLAAKYSYVREIDFCDLESLLFRREDFLAIGGFDDNLITDHSIALDFCFSMRKLLSKKIIFQSNSWVAHPTIKVNTFQRDSKELKYIQNKWSIILADFCVPKDLQNSSEKFLAKKSIIIIDSYLPRYDKESGSHRLFELIKIFHSLGLKIIFIPYDGIAEMPYYRVLTNMGVETIVNYKGRHSFKVNVLEVAAAASMAWICRPKINKKFKFIFDINPQLQWFYDTVDLHFIRLEREAKLHHKVKTRKRALRYRKLELSLAKKSDYTVCITKDEEELLKAEGIKNTVLVPNIHSFGDQVYPDFEKREGILFIGSYDHTPNIDAVLWLIKEIMPLVWNKEPSIKVTLLGNRPTKEILDLQSDKVMVTGYVPLVNEYFSKARIFVAPLRYGAGMKGKLGQSLTFKLPIVSTRIGTEGMNLVNGTHVLEADDKHTFAESILLLYHSQQLWNTLQSNSMVALKEYSPEIIKEQLKQIFST